MAKWCPSCKYGPIGPYTDNCPICAEPVRNVRSGGEPGYRGKMPTWAQWLLGSALAAILVVGGCCAVGMWRFNTAMDEARQAMEQARVQAEADRKARTVTVTIAELLREFAADPDAADGAGARANAHQVGGDVTLGREAAGGGGAQRRRERDEAVPAHGRRGVLDVGAAVSHA